MEKVKNFFRKVGTFCKNTALKVGSFCKSTFLKVKGWALAHKIAAIAIAAGSVVAITLAIVLPVSISAANRNKSQQEPAEPEHVHVFANEWSKNSENHWHAATCGHDVKGDQAAHTFGAWTVVSEEKEQRTCTVCGYVQEKDHVHNFSFQDFVWTETPGAYTAKARYVCDAHEIYDLHDAAVTKLSHTDADCENDGANTWKAEYDKYSDTKVEVIAASGHSIDDYGFCTNCDEYKGTELPDPDMVTEFSKPAGKYFYRFNIDSHYKYKKIHTNILASEFHFYAKYSEVWTPVNISSASYNTITQPDDDYVYLVLETAMAVEGGSFSIDCECAHNVGIDEHGICNYCGQYAGKKVGTDSVFNVSADGVTFFFRFPISTGNHYYFRLASNELQGLGEGRAYLKSGDTFTPIANADKAFTDEDSLEAGEAYFPNPIVIGENIGDGYMYVEMEEADNSGLHFDMSVVSHHLWADCGACVCGDGYIDEGNDGEFGQTYYIGNEVPENPGHYHWGTEDDEAYYRFPAYPQHKYKVTTNLLDYEIFFYYCNPTTCEMIELVRDGAGEMLLPNDSVMGEYVYCLVSPMSGYDDAYFKLDVTGHTGSCIDEHGLCSFGLFIGTELEFNVEAPSFNMKECGKVYFRIAKENFASKTFIHIYCEEFVFYGAHQVVECYYKDSTTGEWHKFGSSSASDHNYYVYGIEDSYESVEDYYYIVVEDKDDWPILGVDTFKVNASV